MVTEMPWAPKKEHRSGRASMRQTLAASSSTTVHAIEERAQADEAAQDALTEAERIRADAETQVAEARDLAEAAATAEATADGGHPTGHHPTLND